MTEQSGVRRFLRCLRDGLEENLVTLIQRRNAISDERVRVQREGEGVVLGSVPATVAAHRMLGSWERTSVCPRWVFDQYMRTEILDLDEQIDQVQHQLERINGTL